MHAPSQPDPQQPDPQHGSAPSSSAPHDSAPHGRAPHGSVPHDSVPHDSVPLGAGGEPLDADGLPFPTEADWLQQELPPELAAIDADAFVARTLQAHADERKLDAGLEQLAAELPRLLLDAFAAPAPTPDFVARATAAVMADRRGRWQQMLARHVAPEPSPEFIARTVAALHAERDEAQRRLGTEVRGRAAAVHAASEPHSPRAITPDGPRQPPSWSVGGRTPWHRTGRQLWPWLTLAAAALAWLATLRPAPEPLERRLAAHSTPFAASRFAPSPLSALMAEHAQAAEPLALANDTPDGVWLLLAKTR